MKKLFFGLLIISIGAFSFCKQNDQLTVRQKVKDFEYLYQTLKDNYPYFGAAKRQMGLDWLAEKENFLNKIKKTKNDREYILTLDSILRKLHDGHLDLLFVRAWQGGIKQYKMIAETDPEYEKWVSTLENPDARPLYWQQILNQSRTEQLTTSEQQPRRNPIPAYRDSIISKDKIGIMRIRSFSYSNITRDSGFIAPFLNKICDFDNLIIDIQNNGGGASLYWKNNIARKLIQNTVKFPVSFAVKAGSVNKYFDPEYFKNSTIIQKSTDHQKIPAEFFDGTYYLRTETDSVVPDHPIPFKGKIYLLVDGAVFSSSEEFAYFCKTTRFATIAGTRTGGDGIGNDPVIIVLPESGIIVRFPVLAGFNSDGSLNVEERTVPDIPLKGGNADERLRELIEYIKKK